MYTAKVQNARGEVLDLTGNSNYQVISIDGLTPPKAEIATTTVSTLDGSRFNYSRLTSRNIVIQLKPLREIEENRIDLYGWFSPKQLIRFFYKNEHRDVYIDGYVESFDGNLFDNPQIIQISIICPDAYFKDSTEVTLDGSYVEPLFEFEFSIDEAGIEFSTYDNISTVPVENKSDTDMGIIIRINAEGEVINPRVYKEDTLESFGLILTMNDGDIAEISTIKGDKYVRLIRNGEMTNIINYVAPSPSWFQLSPGTNLFTYEADSGSENMTISFEYNYIFGGV